MNDWSKYSTADRPLNMVTVEHTTMALATEWTIAMLTDITEMDHRDLATARLALEVAERIDRDGPNAAVSLYNRLHMLLQDLQHKERAYVCPYAMQATQAAPTDPAE